MRLWHRDLIPYLPRKQLIAQWRELCCICKNIATKRTPNHLLVNKVLTSRGDFYAYSQTVINEMVKRGYKVNTDSIARFSHNFEIIKQMKDNPFADNSTHFNYYPYWHNDRYLRQCLYNLQEKYDCGGISDEEWQIIINNFDEYME